MTWEFKAEDFIFSNIHGDGSARLVAQASADRANAKLKEWLSEAPSIYHKQGYGWQLRFSDRCVRRAKLVDIQPLKGSKCSIQDLDKLCE